MFKFSLFNNSIFGLDIGYETLKLVELKKVKNSFGLVGSIEVPLTERILEKDHFKNIEKTADTIKQACQKAKPNKISARKIVSALPETFVFSKTIQMPKMTKQEYDKSIPIEAAQYLPIPVEEVYIDYQVLINHPDESLSDILVVASPKKLVDDYVAMTKLANLELLALETKPIAVGRAIANSRKLNSCVIAEIGTEVTRIAIWEDNSLRLTSTVPTGKNQLSMAGAIGSVTNITEEIINDIKYHQTRDYKPKPIERIYICGSGAQIDSISDLIEKEVKLETEIFSPELIGNKLGTEHITSCGLAMRGEME